MKKIPYLENVNGNQILMVDDAPFQILGGEFYNSSASDLKYMKEKIWPSVRPLGANCFLAPVYWECLEPKQGVYDFSLVEGMLRQAREEGVRLVFLWFGLWKNGKSSYIPSWMKKNSSYFYMKGADGKFVESVSPFCEKAVELDTKAVCHLMEYLKEHDKERTVVMLQVENEVGFWGQPRDFSNRANELYKGLIPEEMQRLYQKNGTWEEAFGLIACEYFMTWAFASAVGKIAASMKEIYPLPLFMNAMVVGVPLMAGKQPSGGPLPHVLEIWKTYAPAIDLYAPDLYSPFYKEICADYAKKNPLFIPEIAADKDVPSKALYCLSKYHTLCFSPFGIESLMMNISEADLLAQTNSSSCAPVFGTGEKLAQVYHLIKILNPEIAKAREEGRLWAFSQQNSMGDEFYMDNCTISVSYGPCLSEEIPGFPPRMGCREENAPMGGGFILRRTKEEFLICGFSCNIEIQSVFGHEEPVFILEKREWYCTENGLEKGRILNGDERNYMILSSSLGIQSVSVYSRE